MTPTPIEFLKQQARIRQGRTAFRFHEDIWTYERILTQSERFARAMVARGVKPGDRVIVHMMNRPEFIAAYYACFLMGAIVAPFKTTFKQAELAPLAERLKPALYIGESALYGNVAGVDDAILPRDRRFVMDTSSAGHDARPLQQLLDGDGSADLPSAVAADQPALLITTSGTTGQPKFVVHTANTLAEMTERVVGNWELSDQDGMAMPLPLAHMSGSACMLCCVQSGTPFVLMESFDADTVLDAIEHDRCSVHVAFPAQYAALLDRQRAQPRDLSSLRSCLTGGDVCPIELQQQVTAAFGIPLLNVWASTEAVGNLGFGTRPGPVMSITDGSEVRLVDRDGRDVGNGEIGELLVRGPNVFVGYWNDPKATAESLKDGWYHTGDLAQRDRPGELLFVSRKKDIIVRAALKISPIEVEQAIAVNPAVEEVAVVGVPDSVLGQRVIGFVKLAKNGAGESAVPAILSDLGKRLAAYKVPETLIVLETLPRNALSKVDRAKLLSMAIEADKVARAKEAASTLPPRIDERRPRRAG